MKYLGLARTEREREMGQDEANIRVGAFARGRYSSFLFTVFGRRLKPSRHFKVSTLEDSMAKAWYWRAWRADIPELFVFDRINLVHFEPSYSYIQSSWLSESKRYIFKCLLRFPMWKLFLFTRTIKLQFSNFFHRVLSIPTRFSFAVRKSNPTESLPVTSSDCRRILVYRFFECEGVAMINT